ncbi:MAG TPA: PAS domain S-box protein, partial [Spirosoma sp.]|nr:PAS domain S-box protein [Spirosoma sp.]
DLCVFASHNLLKDPPFSRLDFISCRNLLIYLDAELQRKAMATFHYALNPNGHLLLGKSETVGTTSPYFMAVESIHKLYARKYDQSAGAGRGQALFDMRVRPSGRQEGPQQAYADSTGADDQAGLDKTSHNGPGIPETQPTAGRSGLRQRKPDRAANDLDRMVDNLLSHYVPASVIVNQDLDILQFRGSTGLFLEPAPGRASLNLLKMARLSLRFELRNITQKASQSGQPARRSGLEVRVNEKVHYVAIEAVPFSTEADERLFLIVFEEVRAIVTAEFDATDVRSQRIKELEEELATLRDDMHSVIEEQEAAHEELQSANEEIISSNEELQSINEELETGKEEIESTNEELLTINQELQVRNDQLAHAQAYTEAVLSSIREATLVLTPDLRIKSANSAFYTLFGLGEGEVEGCLIYDLSNRQWDIPQLRSLLTDVTTRHVQVHGFELTYQFAGLGEKVLSLNASRVVRQHEAILLTIDDITEQRRSQRFLEEREAWFHQIADNAPTLIWVVGPDGQYTFLNNVWLNYTGASLAYVVVNGWGKTMHPDDRERYEKTYQSHFRERKPFQAEYRLRQHDGNYHWMLENAQPIFTPEKEFAGFIGTAANMQAHKELNVELDRLVAERTQELTDANTRLAQTADRLQSLLNGVPASITLMEAVLPAPVDTAPVDTASGDPIDFVTSAFNRQAQELLKETPESMQMKSLLQMNPEFQKNGLFDTYVAVYKTGQSAYREVGFEVGNESHCFAVYITRQVDRQGVVVTALDITDRKEAQEQVRKTAEALQAVLDNSPASIALLKAIRLPAGNIFDFELMVANQRFAQLLNQPIDQLFSLHVGRFAPALWGETTLKNLVHVVETGESFYIEQPHPEKGWLALSVTKQDNGVVITGLDITALKQMQQQREDLLSQVRQSGETVGQLAVLQQQVRLRGELLRASSHDLRGSLGVIQGAADLLIFADTDEDRLQMLDMIQRNVRETTRLITELMDFSRLEAGKQQVVLAPFDAAGLLGQLGENIRPLVEGKGLAFHLSGKKALPVVGDAVNILRIAQNIVLNALKYTDQGSITLHWGVDSPDEWSFYVEDTGPGMDPAQASQLSQMERPSPVPTSLADEPVLGPAPGEGIGLLIVRQLCDLLKGRLLVESQPGQGSVFRIWLPRHY